MEDRPSAAFSISVPDGVQKTPLKQLWRVSPKREVLPG